MENRRLGLCYSEDQCWQCGQECGKIRRSAWQRLWYAAVFECPDCRARTAVYRYPALVFVPLHRCCPNCGETEVTRRRKGDGIEKLHLNPIGLAQALVFAPLWYCYTCRLHFFDLRPGSQPQPEPAEAGQALGAD